MTVATNWTTAWLMTGMGIGVVFCILILLVLVLHIFSLVSVQNSTPATKAVAPKQKAVTTVEEDASDRRAVAIATALYLYMQDAHDEESGILTIHLDEHPAWHAQLNASI